MRKVTRRARRGFTLPELMVSLLAGLFVTMAVVALAKTATTTFHEQVRSTSSEMALRVASQRFAADLERVSYMSTGNIAWDPQIVRLDTAPLPATGSRYLSLNKLAGIRLYLPGAPENPMTGMGIETSNGMRPHAVDLTGNFTSNDQYIISQITAPPVPVTGLCGPQVVTLNPMDASVVKILYLPDGVTLNPNAGAILNSIFMPVAGQQFPARVTDPNSGQTHFVIVASTAVAGTVATITFAPASSGCPVLWAGQGKGGTSGFGENLQIAPLATVRWMLQYLNITELNPPEDQAIKFNLTRQFVNAAGAPVGGIEIISEYAIDLRLAFTVDTTPGAPPTIQSFDFEDDVNNPAWAVQGVGTPGLPAVHRIRSVRFRIADRTAKDDRNQDLTGPPASGFLLRYCLTGAPGPGCTRYSRVRTLVSEVALMNQSRMSY